MYVKNLVRKLCKIRYITLRMSPLPLIWLDNPEALSNVGVDYLGPIFCKAECGGDGTNPCPNTATVKVWVSLFIVCILEGFTVRSCAIALLQLSSLLSDGSSP